MMDLINMPEEELEEIIEDLEGIDNIEEDSDESQSTDSGIEETTEDEVEAAHLLMITHLTVHPQGRPLVPVLLNSSGVRVGILCYIDTGSSMSILNIDLNVNLGPYQSGDTMMVNGVEGQIPIHISQPVSISIGNWLILTLFGLMRRGMGGYGIIEVDVIRILNCLIDLNHRALWTAV
ncbi:unnamed protein product [Caretta caretta]